MLRTLIIFLSLSCFALPTYGQDFHPDDMRLQCRTTCIIDEMSCYSEEVPNSIGSQVTEMQYNEIATVIVPQCKLKYHECDDRCDWCATCIFFQRTEGEGGHGYEAYGCPELRCDELVQQLGLN